MTEYTFNPRYIIPETAESVSAHMSEPVPFHPIPMEYYTREMAIMAIRRPNHARPITYRDTPWTLLGAMPTKESERMNDLKPCPKCGIMPAIFNYEDRTPDLAHKISMIKCPRCGWESSIGIFERCVEEWNRRVNE